MKKLKENYERLFGKLLKEEVTEKARLIILSHLSDIVVLSNNKELKAKANFIKYMIIKNPEWLQKEINADELWKDFQSNYGKYNSIEDDSDIDSTDKQIR